MDIDIKPTLQQIRKDFFSFRNGIVADSLKKIYDPATIIFGLQVPQIIELSRKYPKDIDLAKALWEDRNTRESRLLALYLMPVDKVDKSYALYLINSVNNPEIAEFLAFKVLRLLPFASSLLDQMKAFEGLTSSGNHCLEMLKKNLEVIG